MNNARSNLLLIKYLRRWFTGVISISVNRCLLIELISKRIYSVSYRKKRRAHFSSQMLDGLQPNEKIKKNYFETSTAITKSKLKISTNRSKT